MSSTLTDAEYSRVIDAMMGRIVDGRLESLRHAVEAILADHLDAHDKRGGTHPLLMHPNGDRCIWLEGTGWFVPLDAGGEGYPCTQEHPFTGVRFGDADAERMIGYFVEKHRVHLVGAGESIENALEGIVATTVADTLLVVEGPLSVDDFAPEAQT